MTVKVKNPTQIDCTGEVMIRFLTIHQGCHRSGNGQGKRNFFKVRQMSGNFILSQGKLTF